MLILALLAAGAAGRAPAQGRVSGASAPRARGWSVVIAVDQLRADYLDRFRRFFGPAGFNLFLQRGASFSAARYAHAITETCPGHAVMLTGAYAMVNGIAANAWYDPRLGRAVYCAEDSTVALTGSGGPGRSPRLLVSATVGDVLKTGTAGRSRVITVSGKDRSAIMLGGKRADAAYWLVDSAFVTSTWYRPDLPQWVRAFNATRPVARWLGTTWERVLPAADYAGMGRDDVPSEADEGGTGRVFPHPIASLDGFTHSPLPDQAVAEFAMRAVTAEGLGRDTIPDLLGVGFSATDYVGHAFGPGSHEIMDDVVRLDRTLARLFEFLDRTVGLANVVIVLTADHGVAPMPETAARGRPGTGPRRLDPAVVDSVVSRALSTRFGTPPGPGWIAFDAAPLLSLRRAALVARRVKLVDAEQVAAAAMRRIRGIHEVLTGERLARLRAAVLAGDSASDAVRSYYPARAADLYYFLEPYWLPTSDSTGTGHGSMWAYDQRVPLLWFGRGIAPGVHRAPATVADIAPTLSALLGVSAPGGAQGRVLTELFP